MNLGKVAFAAILTAIPAVASAADIVNTGPVPSSPTYNIFGGGPSGASGVGGKFTLTSTTALTAIQFYGGLSGLTVFGSIRSDGSTPGSVLYNGNISDSVPAGNNWVGLTGLNWILEPGSYWFTFEALNAQSAIRIATNFPNPLAQQSVEFSNVFSATTTSAFGFRVQGDTVIAAVPEPVSWAMMVAGFGLIGGAMRRRQSVSLRYA